MVRDVYGEAVVIRHAALELAALVALLLVGLVALFVLAPGE